jgi:hypothetical protein
MAALGIGAELDFVDRPGRRPGMSSGMASTVQT